MMRSNNESFYHVQTNIQQAPGARVPTVREQGLLAVQLSGQRGGMQRALRSDADLRLCRECQHRCCGDRLHHYDNGSRDDARTSHSDRLEGATDEKSGCENGNCTGTGRHCAGSSTKCQRLTEVRRGCRCQTKRSCRDPDGHLHPGRYPRADHPAAQRHQHLRPADGPQCDGPARRPQRHRTHRGA